MPYTSVSPVISPVTLPIAQRPLPSVPSSVSAGAKAPGPQSPISPERLYEAHNDLQKLDASLCAARNAGVSMDSPIRLRGDGKIKAMPLRSKDAEYLKQQRFASRTFLIDGSPTLGQAQQAVRDSLDTIKPFLPNHKIVPALEKEKAAQRALTRTAMQLIMSTATGRAAVDPYRRGVLVTKMPDSALRARLSATSVTDELKRANGDDCFTRGAKARLDRIEALCKQPIHELAALADEFKIRTVDIA